MKLLSWPYELYKWYTIGFNGRKYKQNLRLLVEAGYLNFATTIDWTVDELCLYEKSTNDLGTIIESLLDGLSKVEWTVIEYFVQILKKFERG